MRAKLDENLPTESVGVLEAAGWQCDRVYDEALTGAEDSRVSHVCRAEGRVLFTVDLDFADIRAYPPAEYEGIVVLRPINPSRDGILSVLERAMPVLSAEWVAHRLWILVKATGDGLEPTFVFQLDGSASQNETRSVIGEKWTHVSRATWVSSALVVTTATTRESIGRPWEWLTIYSLDSGTGNLEVTTVDPVLSGPFMAVGTLTYAKQ